MRTSVITRFAKNDRSISGRRRIAALAATTVLAGGMQLLATDTAWAGTPTAGTPTAAASTAKTPTPTHHGTLEPGFPKMNPAGLSITAGGPKVQVTLSVANLTGAPYQNVTGVLGVYNPADGGLRAEDLTIEVASGGGWKPVKLVHGGGDPSAFTVVSPATTTARLEDGRSVDFVFRVGLSAKASKEMTSLAFVAKAQAPGSEPVTGSVRVFDVTHAAAPAPDTKPTTPAKPAPKPTKSAEPTKAAQPAADQSKDAAPTAAPATTAPAGTPELAHTGSSGTNTFLALSSAAFLALGAGTLVAVRRLRRQH
ncbi:hypothetical protein [Kitasatospora brasiliensis]|uniref:hypothetical protein n=1 Tax=Kitasatospora brasiliensis TaxID=3058040 RepID=UPI00292E4191|nr:hypothetical protein [Kitasatospora sp. K002]